MSKTKMAIVATVLAVGVGAPLWQHRKIETLSAANTGLARSFETLQSERRDRAAEKEHWRQRELALQREVATLREQLSRKPLATTPASPTPPAQLAASLQQRHEARLLKVKISVNACVHPFAAHNNEMRRPIAHRLFSSLRISAPPRATSPQPALDSTVSPPKLTL